MNERWMEGVKEEERAKEKAHLGRCHLPLDFSLLIPTPKPHHILQSYIYSLTVQLSVKYSFPFYMVMLSYVHSGRGSLTHRMSNLLGTLPGRK